MEKLECKVLCLLNKECTIGHITRNLDIKDEELADIIIDLDKKDLVVLKDKKWMVTEKGKDIFEQRDAMLKKLKIEYMCGEIDNRYEYDRRKSELEDISQIISITGDTIEKDLQVEDREIGKTEAILPEIVNVDAVIKGGDESLIDSVLKDGQPKDELIKKICPKCEIENKKESNYCRNCGVELKG